MTPPNNHTCDFMSQPFHPAASRHDYPSFPEHVAKISTGQSFLHPRIDPRLSLHGGFIWGTIAPRHADKLRLSLGSVIIQGRRPGAMLYEGIGSSSDKSFSLPGFTPSREPASECHHAWHVRNAILDSFAAQRSAGSLTAQSAIPCKSARPADIPMRINERSQDLNRRSSSAWAKNALASFNISLALLLINRHVRIQDAPGRSKSNV